MRAGSPWLWVGSAERRGEVQRETSGRRDRLPVSEAANDFLEGARVADEQRRVRDVQAVLDSINCAVGALVEHVRHVAAQHCSVRRRDRAVEPES